MTIKIPETTAFIEYDSPQLLVGAHCPKCGAGKVYKTHFRKYNKRGWPPEELRMLCYSCGRLMFGYEREK